MRLSHPQFHKKNLKISINILLDNGYPLHFIFNTINRRIKTLINYIINPTNITTEKENNNNYFVIPYINNISELVASVIKKSDFMVGYHCLRKLDKVIKAQKDKNNDPSNTNVIYKINCNSCDARRMLVKRKDNYVLDLKNISIT